MQQANYIINHERLKAEIKKAGLTFADLESSGLSKRSLYSGTGDSPIPIKYSTIERIANKVGVGVEEIARIAPQEAKVTGLNIHESISLLVANPKMELEFDLKEIRDSKLIPPARSAQNFMEFLSGNYKRTSIHFDAILDPIDPFCFEHFDEVERLRGAIEEIKKEGSSFYFEEDGEKFRTIKTLKEVYDITRSIEEKGGAVFADILNCWEMSMDFDINYIETPYSQDFPSEDRKIKTENEMKSYVQNLAVKGGFLNKEQIGALASADFGIPMRKDKKIDLGNPWELTRNSFKGSDYTWEPVIWALKNLELDHLIVPYCHSVDIDPAIAMKVPKRFCEIGQRKIVFVRVGGKNSNPAIDMPCPNENIVEQLKHSLSIGLRARGYHPTKTGLENRTPF